MSFTCPTCSRTIYNRRRVTCEFCAAVIPSELLFNPAQIAAIERLKTIEENEHREFMQRPNYNGTNISTGGSYF